MKKIQKIKKQKGFSLIELMVVVAIIGILAAVAIPAFDGFRKKARSGEAKTNLGALYTAEKAFQYESTGYCHNLNIIGFDKPDGATHYTIGFNTALTTLPSGCVTGGASDLAHENTVGTKTSAIARAACKIDNSVNPQKFTACAEGNSGQTSVQKWEIKQDKILTAY